MSQINPQSSPEPRTAAPGLWQQCRRHRWLKMAAAILALLFLAGGLFLAWRALFPTESERLLHTVRKMDLQVAVLEGGSISSTNNLEIKSDVEGQTTILSIVPDGTIITDEDVKKGKILVELDAAAMKERAAQQEISFNDANASFTQARESFAIQKNQNESNIQEGELKVKFGRMDLEKYLGAELAAKLLAGQLAVAAVLTLPSAAPGAAPVPSVLGGTALQTWRKLQSNIDLAREEVSRARDRADWSKRLGPQDLGGNGYISKSELEADNLALKRKDTETEQAILEQQIFLDYTFIKEVEKLLSDYREFGRELERIKAKARSEMAKVEAELKSKEASFNLQKERFEKINRQIASCIIKAPQTGMVVYPSTGDWWRGSQNKIEEGTIIRERQVIITIPDPAKMGITVRVHEAMVDRVKPDQRARVIPDAFPDTVLWGKVEKVAILPDTQNPFLSPDLKVYSTTITLDKPPVYLKTGMSAQVEIIVANLPQVLAVPLQSVVNRNGKRVCYVSKGRRVETRIVETGQSNDSFIQIVKGLQEGDRIQLQPQDDLTQTETKSAAPPPEAATSPAKTGKDRPKTPDQTPPRRDGNPPPAKGGKPSG